ncbi:MAG: cadherin-like domain-containing protein [Burkholderiaceae bacterium]
MVGSQRFYPVTVRATSSDGSQSELVVNIEITHINAVPAATGSTKLLQAGEQITISGADLGYSDPDGDALAAIRIGSLPASGTLSLGATPVAVGDRILAADIAGGNLRYTAAVSANEFQATGFSFTVEDSFGALATSPASIDLNFNAPPSLVGFPNQPLITLSVAENASDVTLLQLADPDSATVILSLTGADAAAFQFDALNERLIFVAPPDYEQAGDLDANNVYELTVHLDDGEGGIVDQAFAISVTNVIEPLTLTTPAQILTDEDTPVALSAAPGYKIVDAEQRNDLVLEITVASGTLQVGATPPVPVSGSGQPSDPLIAQGSAASLELLLAGLQYQPLADQFGTVSMSVSLADPAASPSARSIGTTIAIEIAPVNDVPVVTTATATSMLSSDMLSIGPTVLSATDVDDSPSALVYTLAAAPSAGDLRRDGQPLSTGQSFTQADIDAGRITYVAWADQDAVESLNLQLGDAAGAGGPTRLSINIVAPVSAPITAPPPAPAAAPPSAPVAIPTDSGEDSPGAASATSSGAAESAASASTGDEAIGTGSDQAPESAGIAPVSPESGAARSSVASSLLENGGGTDGAAADRGRGHELLAARKTLPATDAVSSERFHFDGMRIVDLDAFESLGTDRSADLAQVDRVWLDAPITDSLQRTFAQHHERVQTDLVFDQQVAASSVAVSTGVSIGYVIWLLRGGALLSSIIASMPAWRSIDPLPVLHSMDASRAGDRDEESIESMLEAANQGAPTDGSHSDGHPHGVEAQVGQEISPTLH